MKTVYLMRHAKSSWDNAQMSDKERPLNNRGRHDANLMAKELLFKNAIPDCILTSDSERTLETVHYLTTHLDSKVIETSKLYLATNSVIIDHLRGVPDHFKSVLILAHNPGITDANNLLCKNEVFNMPTAAIACIKFAVQSFDEINKNGGKLEFYIYPKMFY